MTSTLFQFLSCLIGQIRRDEGQTMAEYGILIAVIALVVVVAATVLGGNLTSLFSSGAAAA